MTARLQFGRCELRPQERLLLIDGQPVALGARAFDVLLVLAERRDRVVSKTELLDLAWPGLVVEENNLSVQISVLRKVLGAHAIATIPALGYRFAMSTEVGTLPDDRNVALPGQVADTWAGLLQQAGCQLVAHIGGASALPSRAPLQEFVQMLAGLVAAHGGVLVSSGAEALVADFSSAREAAACSHRMHHAASQVALIGTGAGQIGLRIGLQVRAPRSAGGASPVSGGLATLAAVGETLASASIASQLVTTLDGDLQDLGEHHGPPVDTPLRTFRLTSPVPEARSDRRIQPAGNLRPTVAVIPFAPYARQPEPVSLGDIVTDQLISALSKSHALNVISRLSTLAFRDRETPLAQIARRLGADYVVSGRYGVVTGRVHVQAELADAASGRVLWSGTVVDSELAALYSDSALVLALVGAIVQAVFAHQITSLRSAALPDLASHTLLLAAISLLYRLSPHDFALARSALETVQQRAPRHPAPRVWLARWHLFRVVQRWSDNRDEDGQLALEHASRALELDPDSALALTMLGNVHTSYLLDLDRAERYYDQALAINPNESLTWLQKANARSFRGDGAAAVEYAQRAVNLSPLDPASHFYLTILASAALTAQDYSRAIEAARASARLNQLHLSTHRVLAIALAMTGRLDEARASVAQVLRLDPTLTVAHYQTHSPAAGSELVRSFGAALHSAGLPLGTA